MKQVSFKNKTLNLAGLLFFPVGFDPSKKYPALVLSTPGSSVKEQIGSIYAKRMAELGFVALTFDPSYQGASEGEPRDLEDPHARSEDIRCALDFLVTLDFVHEDRIGLLGLCAGGSCAISAALTDHRFRAVATVVASDIGSAFRQMLGKDLLPTLKELGQQRTAEARGAPLRRDPWIPDTLAEAHAAGIEDPDLLEAIHFYRESEYRHPRSTNRLLFRSYGELLGFSAFHLVPDLLTQPLQVIVGGRKGTTGQFENGRKLFELSRSAEKDFFVVEGAGHYEMYFKEAYVSQATAKLQQFFQTHLGDR